jgi:hypothetical protein
MVEEFIAWLKTKPADEDYNPMSNRACCFAQFLMETGRSAAPWVGGTAYSVDGYPFDEACLDKHEPIPEELQSALISSYTFGGVLRRLGVE